MSPCAILCVDDEYIILKALREELRFRFGERYSYESAFSADEAMTLIEELSEEGVRVILIISDLLMPGIKGDEFLIQVRRRFPGIRSIMVTGHADKESVARAINEAGAYRVLPKPWDSEELLRAVAECVAAAERGG